MVATLTRSEQQDIEVRLQCADLAVRVLPHLNNGTAVVTVMETIYSFVTAGHRQ